MADEIPPPSPPIIPPLPPPISPPPPPTQPPRRPLPPIEPRPSRGRFVVWASVFVVIVAIVIVGLVALAGLPNGDGGSDSDKATPTPAEATPDASAAAATALESYVRDVLALEYAGDCSASILPKGEGRLCSTFKGERLGQRAYILGASSYESTTWVFLRQDGGDWQVYATQPVKPDTANVPGAPWPLEKGAKVIVLGTGNCLNVRVSPGINEAPVDCLADGTEVTIAEGPLEMDGFQWWRLEDRSGWVAGDWLRYPEGLATATTTPAAATPTSEQ